MALNIKELAVKISKIEGKKSQVSIGDIREILAIIKKLIKNNPEILLTLTKGK